MVACGILLLLAGVISYAYGISLNNDIDTYLSSVFEKGETSPGSTFIVLGVVAMVIGLVLLILGIVKSVMENRDEKALSEDRRPLPAASDFFCAFCGAVQTGNAIFCSQCGTRLKETVVQKSQCPVCGTIYLTEEAMFCSKCGTHREDR